MFRKVDSGLSDQKIERLKEKQTGRQTKTDKDRYTNRQRQIDKQTDRQRGKKMTKIMRKRAASSNERRCKNTKRNHL